MNVCTGDDEDYITETTFDVVLTEPDVYVPLDLSSYTNDSVLLYDFDVIVSFDVPEIDSGFDLTLEANKEFVPATSSLTLTAKLSKTGASSLAGYTVEWFENGVSIGSTYTNVQGVTGKTYTPTAEGVQTYTCKVLGMTKSVNVETGKYNPSLSLTSNKSVSYIPTGSFTVTGTLSNPAGAINNATVKLYDGDTLLDTLTTNSSGKISKTISTSSAKVYQLTGVFDGNTTNNSITSSNLVVTARKKRTILSPISMTPSTGRVARNKAMSFTATLTDETGAVMANKPVKVSVYRGSPTGTPAVVETFSTDTNGVWNLSTVAPSTPQDYYWFVEFEDTSTHTGSREGITFTVY